MALDWFRSSSKKLTIDELIARKKYDEAAGRIREQLTRRRSNPRLRQLLADVLLKGGKIDEAAEMLVNLADEQLRYETVGRLLQTVYAHIRTSIRGA